MTEHLFKILSKENIEQFSNSLRSSGMIYAPVKVSKETYSFKKVDSLYEADLEYSRTMIPPKKFFISPSETIFTFSKEKEEYYETIVINERARAQRLWKCLDC